MFIVTQWYTEATGRAGVYIAGGTHSTHILIVEYMRLPYGLLFLKRCLTVKLKQRLCQWNLERTFYIKCTVNIDQVMRLAL